MKRKRLAEMSKSQPSSLSIPLVWVATILSVFFSVRLIGQDVSLPYDHLTEKQRALFSAYKACPDSCARINWAMCLSPSERLQFAGGTQAIQTVKIRNQARTGLDEVNSLAKINGRIPAAKSASQFNLEVNWTPVGHKSFASLTCFYIPLVRNCWSPHVAWLHRGQFGYQENRKRNPFLGLVVLFDKKTQTIGQFHIGFKSWFWHYNPNNGNIAANYRRYRDWYGKIPGYLP